MATREETIRQLMRQFATEWARQFPLTPTPVIRALSSLRGEEPQEQTGLSFDEWLASGAADQLANTLDSARQKITQLQDQLARKVYLYEFVCKLLQCVGDKQTADELRVPVSTVSSTPPLDLNVTPLYRGSVGVYGGGTRGKEHCPPSAQSLSCAGQQRRQLGVNNVEQTTCLSSPLLEQQNWNIGVNCSEDSDKAWKSSPAEKFTTAADKEGRATFETGTGTVKQTTFSPVRATNLESVTSGDCVQRECTESSVYTTQTVNDTRHTKRPTECVEYQRYTPTQRQSGKCVSDLTRERGVCGVVGSGGIDTGDRNSSQCGSGTKNAPRIQPPTTSSCPQLGETTLTAALDRHEYSPQRGGREERSCPITQPLSRRLPPPGKQFTVQVASVTCATQTDISFGVREHWIVSSAHEDTDVAMFWNRKKPGAKRSEDTSPRDRDNSGVLGRRHSDVPDLPAAPPARTNSPLNVQYLKLTDGFSIVLDSDGQKDDTGDDASGGEETYDNNTSGRTHPHKPPKGGRVGGGTGEVTTGAGRQQSRPVAMGRVAVDPVRNVPQSGSPLASSPLTHAPVSRASSDTTGLRPSPSRHSPPPPVRSSKPLPVPRKKLPLPPSKPKTAATVLYVDRDTTESPSLDDIRRKEDPAPPLPNKEKDSAPEDRGRGSFSDTPNRTCADSGRGPSIAPDATSRAAVHALPEKNTRRAPESPSHFDSSFSGTDRLVHNVSTASADQALEKTTAGRVVTTAPPLSTPSSVLPRTPGLRQSHTEQKPEAGEYSEIPSGHQYSEDLMRETVQSGIQDLCQSSANIAVKINQRLATNTTTTTTTTVSDSDSVINTADAESNGSETDEMFTLKRHNLSANSSENIAGGSPGVYRKNVQPVPTQDSHPGNEPPDSHPHLPPSPALESPPGPATYHETDIDAITTTTSASPESSREEQRPLPPLPPKKRPKQNTFENWTIDRIVTRKVDANSDDYDDDDEDSDTPSPESTLKRERSPAGSKDSGLCLEVQGTRRSTGVPEVTVSPATGEGDPGQEEEEGGCSLKPIGDRINSIDELNQLQDDDDDDDYATLSFRCEDNGAEQEDNISIASDIVFIPGAQVGSGESPEVQRRSMSHLQPPHGARTSLSTSEDEQESPPSADTSYDDADGLDTPVAVPSPRDNMLKMRHLLVTSILDTEKCYLEHLDILIHYKRTLEGSCRTSQPVICEEDIKLIFSNLQKLQEIHKEFVESLQGRVDDWSSEQTVGDIFKWLVVMFPESEKYAENYQSAVATIHRCCQESHRFQELAQQIVMTSALGQREKPSLEGALFKPVQRMQRNTLVLFDLIKHTPEDHADYEMLQKALSLSQLNLENFGTAVEPNKVEEKRTLVKSSFVVELVSGWRKLRFIFLFSDLLVCTKMDHHRGGKVTFDCKWFIPMNALSLVTKRGYEDDMKFSKKDDIDDLKKKLRSLKAELKQETKKEENKDKHWSGISGIASSRHIEKLKKKIKELERDLILSSPKLPFKVWCDSVKPHTLLMTTDYEREEWREVLTALRRRSVRLDATPPSAFEVQEIVNSVKELPEVNKVGSMLAEIDEEAIYGTLNVTIHKLNGLKDACDTYCCLEMDSLGHFFMKARTHICCHSMDPSWNEDFELELDGSQTLRILCYRKVPDGQGDILLGRGALEMSKHWLKSSFQEKTVVMNEYSLVLSVRYTAAEQTMRRTPSKHNQAVFGVKISACAKREGKTVPTIVTTCIQEVEKRGLDEMGIYRVSGTTSEVQKAKKHFDKNVKVGVNTLSELPVHSVTSALKLYLRELPDPLFTEASYTNFVDALKLSDAEGKEKCMLSLLHGLPDTNYYTAVDILEHLHRVSKNEKENKMSINNLSTIFGPTLLAPAIKETGATMSEMMSIGTEQYMKQSAIVYYFLSLLVHGRSLRRSSQT